MTTKTQTALRLALEAKRFCDLADIEVHRTRRGHWHPPDVPPAPGAARWATRAPPRCSAASSSGPPDSPSPAAPSRPLLAAGQTEKAGLLQTPAGCLR
jgi:hypothetical protein